jgi:hypothetical protein
MNLKIYEVATQQYLSGDVIHLSTDSVYLLMCSTLSSPPVQLNIIGETSNKVLFVSNNSSNMNMYWYTYGFFTNMTVSLDFSNNQYENLTSVTCATNSSICSYCYYNVFLEGNITQNVVVSKSGKRELLHLYTN